jgi:hypothetical protein
MIVHHYHQQTNKHLSPLPLTNKKSSLTITINKQTVISNHYHQQTSNHLSPLPSTNKQSRDDCLLMVMVRDDWLFVKLLLVVLVRFVVVFHRNKGDSFVRLGDFG